MKYVSPVCEVEVLETKDIMVASTNVAGVTVFGGVDAVNHSKSGTFNVEVEKIDPETGNVVLGEDGNPVYETIENGGFGLSLDFSKLS